MLCPSLRRYGDKWVGGDVIGVTLDVDNDTIEYYRNGASMGVAFTKLEKGPGISFFPAVSLGYNQGIQANFGSMPFKYPVEGYMALQAEPIVQVEKAKLLFRYLINLANVISRNASCKDKKVKEDNFSTRKTVYVVFCTLIIEKLSPLLADPYIIDSVWLDVVRQLCAQRWLVLYCLHRTLF